MHTTNNNSGTSGQTRRPVVRAIVAGVGTLALTLSASPPAAAATQAYAYEDCPWGYSCYYDGFNGRGLLFIAARCGTHDFRGGPYQNKINSVANFGSGDVRLDIWRNAGHWDPYTTVPVADTRDIGSNDIDRIRIVC
jgi:hypothetical protein